MKLARVGVLGLTLLPALVRGLLGCSSSSPARDFTPAVDAAPPVVDAGPVDAAFGDANTQPGFDLANGTWQTLQVSHTPGTISHDCQLAFLADGTLTAAWSEPDSVKLSIQNIWTARLLNGGAGWSNEEARTHDTATQNAYPTLASVDARLHLVWNAYPNTFNDLFHLSYENGAWSSPALDVTAPSKPAGHQTDYQPRIAKGPNGELAVAYMSQPADDGGGPLGVSEVRVIRLNADGTPTGAPVVAVPAPASGGACYNPTVIFDAAGHLHVAADCGQLNDEDIYYATDASGSFTVTQIPGVGRDDDQPSLAKDVDGKTLYLTWAGYLPCATKSGKCGEIFFTKIDAGGPGVIGSVTETADENENTPRAVVDRYGRLIVAFVHFNKDNFADIYLTWSADKSNFAPVKNLTPGTDAQDDTGLSSFALHPLSGVPHLVYYSVLAGTNPLNSEIMHVSFVPAAVR